MDDARRTSKKVKKNEARKDLFVGAVEDLKAISRLLLLLSSLPRNGKKASLLPQNSSFCTC